MNALRTIAAVLIGYVVFAMASMMLVGQVMDREGPVIVVVGLVALAMIGLAAGYVASSIAGGKGRLTGCILAGLVAVATLANLVMQLGAEPTWYKVGTLILTAPMILLVGLRGSRPEKTG